MNHEYQIEFLPAAVRDLKKLSVDVQKKLGKKIDSLAANPRPEGCVKLSDSKDLYRIRVGDYRVIYKIYDAKLVVLIVEAGHRREIYRDY
ncbi:MAG: type II toxin-antitoxin system RelE/ParE family toxin [Sphingobacteriaceae bacterium]|nr:type II toxin-antitoxin system RelE/ParE family toxin [Cytophagaceae bacterium]